MRASTTTTPAKPSAPKPDRYAWIALANTTAAIFMASLDGSLPSFRLRPGRRSPAGSSFPACSQARFTAA
jgi:hypothetical protein